MTTIAHRDRARRRARPRDGRPARALATGERKNIYNTRSMPFRRVVDRDRIDVRDIPSTSRASLSHSRSRRRSIARTDAAEPVDRNLNLRFGDDGDVGLFSCEKFPIAVSTPSASLASQPRVPNARARDGTDDGSPSRTLLAARVATAWRKPCVLPPHAMDEEDFKPVNSTACVRHSSSSADVSARSRVRDSIARAIVVIRAIARSVRSVRSVRARAFALAIVHARARARRKKYPSSPVP